MKKLSILLIIVFISLYSFAQKGQISFVKDTLIITNYEAIKFIKIAGKVYQIKTELVYMPVSEYPNTAFTINPIYRLPNNPADTLIWNLYTNPSMAAPFKQIK